MNWTRDLNGGTLVTVTWSVSPPTRALISVNGLITPLLLGPITVTATVDGVSGSISISIVP